MHHFKLHVAFQQFLFPRLEGQKLIFQHLTWRSGIFTFSCISAYTWPKKYDFHIHCYFCTRGSHQALKAMFAKHLPLKLQVLQVITWGNFCMDHLCGKVSLSRLHWWKEILNSVLFWFFLARTKSFVSFFWRVKECLKKKKVLSSIQKDLTWKTKVFSVETTECKGLHDKLHYFHCTKNTTKLRYSQEPGLKYLKRQTILKPPTTLESHKPLMLFSISVRWEKLLSNGSWSSSWEGKNNDNIWTETINLTDTEGFSAYVSVGKSAFSLIRYLEWQR